MKMLCVDNAKTPKGERRGWLTGVMYLAPVDLSGFQVCPMASKGCAAACLNTAGRGGMDRTQRSRIAKTKLYFSDRPEFMRRLVYAVRALVRRATKLGLRPAVRLNGTSDILWERVPVGGHPNIMAMFPDVMFYDYTKHIPGKRLELPHNYRLTYSLSDDPRSEERAHAALDMGWNVSVVFRDKLPEWFMGRLVVDGDHDDLRFLDPPGVVVGLKAKGKAKTDRSGFVRD